MIAPSAVGVDVEGSTENEVKTGLGTNTEALTVLADHDLKTAVYVR